MILYHGTDILSANNICSNGIDIKCGLKYADFGQGFYTTPDYDRAVAWANRKSRARKSSPSVLEMTFDEKRALPYIESFSDDLRWARFVVNNRIGPEYIKKVPFQENNLDARYAITYGRIADLELRRVLRELELNNIMLSDKSFIYNEKYPCQYAFHTSNALSYLSEIRRCKHDD